MSGVREVEALSTESTAEACSNSHRRIINHVHRPKSFTIALCIILAVRSSVEEHSPNAQTSHRLDTGVYTPEESAEHSLRATDIKPDLKNDTRKQTKQKNSAETTGCRRESVQEKCCALKRACNWTELGTSQHGLRDWQWFVEIDLAVLQDLFSKTLCGECGISVKFIKLDKQYGLAVKVQLAWTVWNLYKECFKILYAQ